MDPFLDGRNMKVAVASVLRMAEQTACHRLRCMVRSLYMGWHTEKPVNWDWPLA